MKKVWIKVFLTGSLFASGLIVLYAGWMKWIWTGDSGLLILGFILPVCAVLVWVIFASKKNRTPRFKFKTQRSISQEERKVLSDLPIKEQQISIFCPKCGRVS